MKIARRNFLIAGGAGATALFGSGVALLNASVEDGIVDSVRRSFPGLVMDDEELREFARQMAAVWEMSPTNSRMIATALDYFPARWIASMASRERVRRARGRIAGRFLRATNYLDPSRGDGKVMLVAHVDPYEAICSNMVSVFEGQQLTWPAEEA